MDDISTGALLVGIAGMILISAYFSSSETAMMALNRYRLRHLVKERHKGARKANRLLQRPDRLLGVILIGNNLVNFAAASLGTVIGIRLLGDLGVALAPFVLTFVFLVLAEVAPKTIAAHVPEKIAFPSSYVLTHLLRLLYPFVWLVNGLANALLKPFMSDTPDAGADRLTIEELRTVLHEGSRLPMRRQNMLLSILDLEKVTVDDIMVPRSEIIGVDIEDDVQDIVDQLCTTQHTRLPVFRANVNEVIGILHVRNAIRFLRDDDPTREVLLQHTREPYFVPEGTPLHTQLFNFQNNQRRVALVVDEYGDVQGLVTLEDILEEVVGEFTTDLAANIPEIHPQPDGSHIIDGTAVLREINRALEWRLPTSGPKTMNGLLLELLETIPDSPCCISWEHYRFEVLQVKDNAVRAVRVTLGEVFDEDPDPPEG